MDLQVHRIENGKWKENTYIIHNSSSFGVIIDPGENFDEITKYIQQSKLQIQAILNTHGHFDHIATVSELKKLYKTHFYLHSDDFKLLRTANFYRHLFEGNRNIQIPEVDYDLKSKNTVQVDDMIFEVIPCPGHTEGGVSFKIGDRLFLGDNIIGHKIGRTDLPGGNRAKLEDTIRRLCSLPPNTEVYPGHGPMTKMREILENHTEILKILSQVDMARS
ncbi:MAG: MBL fold metallo-hydrolase [Pseudobdellovibrionaceae bacterium]